MKEKFYNAIVNGVRAKDFPKVPVDYGYRDSKYFWYSKFKKPIAAPIPAGTEMDIKSVRYAADRLNTDVKFSDDALKGLVKVPRVFLKTILQGCVKYAEENNIALIDEKVMKDINDKRKKEKDKK